MKMHFFCETSAKTNDNVEKAFVMASKILFKKFYKTIIQNKNS